MLSKKTLINFLPLILILFLAVFARFIFLDKVPNAIGGDEMVYVLNAKASFVSGYDIFGKWSPWQGLLFQYPQGETQAELPYILDYFLLGPLPLNLFDAHLPNALLGILLIVFVFLSVKELLGRQVALFAAFLTSINPWFVYIGRTAYEAVPAALFYFISLYILLKAKGWKILIAFPFLVLAFYSYIATKLIMVPFALAICVYVYFYINKKKYLRQYLILLSLCVLFVLFYVVSLKLNPSTSRLGELLTPFNSDIASQVDAIRKTSIQTPFTGIFTNKYTVFANIIFTKVFNIFSSAFLFATGDEFFSIWRHGLFYYIDALFIVLGSLFMFSKKRAVFVFIASLLLIGIIPHVIHAGTTNNFSIHQTMMYPFLIILAGFGIYESIAWFKNKNVKRLAAGVIVVLYLFSFANFMNIYLYWFPLQGYFDFPVRIVSSYAKRASNGQKVTIYSTASFDYFKKYLFYINGYNKQTEGVIAKNLNNKVYTLGNVTFVSCNIPDNLDNKNNLDIFDVKCGENLNLKHLSISRLSDGGETFQIYNDKICQGVALNRYPQNITLNDFNIESLTNGKFCNTFVSSL